jgi:hypothetical protein
VQPDAAYWQRQAQAWESKYVELLLHTTQVLVMKAQQTGIQLPPPNGANPQAAQPYTEGVPDSDAN